MERWVGKVAVITGASSGIGASIFTTLAKYPMKIVGLARRKHLLDDLAKKCSNHSEIFTYECDVSIEENIQSVFASIEKTLGGIDILINNAGVAFSGTFADTPPSTFRHQLDVNLMGLSICTQETLKIMHKHQINDGHIINISSVAAHKLVSSNMAMYAASKHGVKLISDALRQELCDAGSKIKISCISPGKVNTDIFKTPTMLLSEEDKESLLEPEDIAEACIYILSTPPRVQIQDIIIKPMGEKF